MSTPTPPAPLVSQLARRWRVDVDTTPSAGSPTWVQVRGIRSLSPTTPATLQDDSDYDNEGWGSQVKTMMNWSLELTVKVGTVAGARDPGQAVIEDASTEFDEDGVVHCRWYERDGGPRAFEGFAQAAWDESGGGVDALAEATATLTGMGIRSKITNPAGA